MGEQTRVVEIEVNIDGWWVVWTVKDLEPLAVFKWVSDARDWVARQPELKLTEKRVRKL